MTLVLLPPRRSDYIARGGGPAVVDGRFAPKHSGTALWAQDAKTLLGHLELALRLNEA